MTVPKGMQYRTVTVEREADTNRLVMSLSSEQPVERGFGREVLDHSESGVDLSYAPDGTLPLLLDHTTREHVGVIEGLHLGDDRRLRGYPRFSRSAKGQEVQQDVEDGIRRNVSVGYELLEELSRSRDGQQSTIRFRWRPVEGSLVAVPADITVGVGRSQVDAPLAAAAPADSAALPGPTAVTPKERSMSDSTAAAQAETVTGPAHQGNITVTAGGGATRDQQLRNIAKTFGKGVDTLDSWISAERTVESVLAEIRDEQKAKAVEPLPYRGRALDVSPKETRVFSAGRMIRAMMTGNYKDAGYEREVSNALAQHLGSTPTGFFMPTELPLAKRTSLTTGGATTGQDLVFTEPGSFIELLRNQSRVISLGPLMLTGLQGNVAIPRQTAAGTAAWVAENPGADYTESNLTLDQVTLSPKNVAATQSFSKQLVAQSIEAVDTLVQADILATMALLFDLGCLHGSGASNQITGIYSQSSVNSVAFGGSITYAKAVDMEAAVEADNANVAAMAYLATPETKAAAKKAQRFSSTDTPVWTGGMVGEMNGYPAYATNQLSKVLGAGTNEHGIVFGAWSQAIVGDWGAIDMTVDTVTKARQGVINVTGFHLVDFAVRHPESFCKGTGLIP